MSFWDYIRSADFWTALFSGMGGTVVAIILLRFFCNAWLRRRIEGSVNDVYKAKEQERQAAYNTALETHKSHLAKEMEGWKTGYQNVLNECQVRFSRLHADRADAIRQLYVRLVKLEETLRAFVTPSYLVDNRGDKWLAEIRKVFFDFDQYFTQNRIFFSPTDCLCIDDLRKIAEKAYMDYTIYEVVPEELEVEDKIKERQLRYKAYLAMTEKFPALRINLEREFRAAMGFVQPVTSTEGAK